MTDPVRLPHLDLVVGQACELRCVACTNGIGMSDHLPVFPYDHVIRDLANAAQAMRADKVTILGGEALLHRRIVDIIEAVRESGITDVVQVLTNGIALHRMDDRFWEQLDWLKISIYPGRTPPENIDLARRMQDRWDFQLDFYDVAADPFRAVHTKTAKTPAEAQQTYNGCWYRTFTRKLEDGYFWRCCTSPSISRVILREPPGTDGLLLDGLTPGRLQQFLDQPDAMRSCTRCHGHLGERIPVWSEERRRDRWLQESAR